MTGWLFYLGLGAVSGVAAGLLGIGGGLIIVPALFALWAEQGLDNPALMQLALGTSMAVIVPTSLSSIRAHYRRGAVNWVVLRRIWPGIVGGAVLGVILASQLDSAQLKQVFSVFVLLVAARMAIGGNPDTYRGLPGGVGMSGAGLGIGGVSALMGIGGGTLTVPFLRWCGVAMREAVGTAAAVGLPIALASVVAYIVAGESTLNGLALQAMPGFDGLTFGYVHGPAFAAIGLAAVVTAPLGAWLAHYLPPQRLQKVFALVLAVIGVRLLVS